MIVLLGIGMIIGWNEKSPYEIQEELESNAIENYDNGSDVYINQINFSFLDFNIVFIKINTINIYVIVFLAIDINI